MRDLSKAKLRHEEGESNKVGYLEKKNTLSNVLLESPFGNRK